MVRRRRTSDFSGIVTRAPFQIVQNNPGIVTATSLAILVVLAVCVALSIGRDYLLPIAVALVFSVLLSPLCRLLEHLWIPRPVAALLSLVTAGFVVWAAFSLIAQPASTWIEDAPRLMRRAERHLQELQAPLKPLNDISKEVDGLSIGPPTTPSARTVVVQEPTFVDTIMATAQTAIVQTGFIFVLSFFLLITREEFRIKFIAFRPSLPERVRAARVFRDVSRRVTGYIVTFSLINVGVGVATGLACWRLGLPEPLMWGGLAMLLNFIPFLGPIIMIGLLGLAGLGTFDKLLDAFFPMLAFWVVNLIESNLVTPTIVGRRMTLNPLAIILVVSFWTWLWGPVGGLVALPLLIMFKVVCDHTPSLRVIGALIGAPLVRVPVVAPGPKTASAADAIKAQAVPPAEAPMAVR